MPSIVEEVQAFLVLTPPADLNASLDDGEDNRQLHEFAEQGLNERAVALLVSAGVLLDVQNAAGDTALHISAREGHFQGCVALLKAGASPLVRNAKNRTPGGQQKLESLVKDLLDQAEQEDKQRRQGKREALYGAKIQATQTQSAVGVGVL